jgi:hypothetical protein
MLGIAFTVEGLLFAFHLEGDPLNYNMHLLLVMCVFGAALCIFSEIRFPNSILLSTLRALVVLLQGVWFCMIAKVLFEGTSGTKPMFEVWLSFIHSFVTFYNPWGPHWP